MRMLATAVCVALSAGATVRLKPDATYSAVRGVRLQADLSVAGQADSDPIRNIRAVRWTIRDGRVYDAPALWKSVRFQP